MTRFRFDYHYTNFRLRQNRTGQSGRSNTSDWLKHRLRYSREEIVEVRSETSLTTTLVLSKLYTIISKSGTILDFLFSVNN